MVYQSEWQLQLYYCSPNAYINIAITRTKTVYHQHHHLHFHIIFEEVSYISGGKTILYLAPNRYVSPDSETTLDTKPSKKEEKQHVHEATKLQGKQQAPTRNRWLSGGRLVARGVGVGSRGGRRIRIALAGCGHLHCLSFGLRRWSLCCKSCCSSCKYWFGCKDCPNYIQTH